jgi:CelD/BcsL family acetyltransferase involved in cellulose biosynthesis
MRRLQSAGALRVSLVQSSAGFAGLRGEWEQLVDAGTASVFNRWAWIYPWWQRLHPDWEPWILEARGVSGELRGLLALGLHTVRRGGIPVRRLALLGEDAVGSDYLDVISRRGEEHAVGALFGTWLLENGREWDVLELQDVEVGSEAIHSLVSALPPEWSRWRWPRFTCPMRSFAPGEAFDTFLWRTARRDNFLRRRKWWGKQLGFALRITTEPGALAGPLSSFFELHERRWASEGGSQGIRGPKVEAFHRDATWLLAQEGRLRLSTLELDGHAVAAVYGIVDRGTFHYYQGGYAPEWAGKSVGLVLVGETFRDALSLGCSRYDFLRGTEPYKGDWVDDERHTEAWRVLSPGMAGRLFHASWSAQRAARQWVKAVLPPGLTGMIQGRRRRAPVA